VSYLRTGAFLNVAALAVTATLFVAAPSRAAAPIPEYLGRPIYSDPTSGLQMPPTCIIEPTWRSRITGAELEVWVVNCDSVARVWQCTAAGEESGVVVRGARWRSAGRELHLAGARGAVRVDGARHRLIDADLTTVDCTRFPDREAMMRKLQQSDHSIR
jgi:hypothetical protein